MLSDIRNAIKLAIESKYPLLSILPYVKNQGVECPYFSIKLSRVLQEQIVGLRYFRNHSFEIYYCPGKVLEEQMDIEGIAETLIDCLESVSSTEKYHTKSIMYEIREDGLHVFVDYNFTIRRELEAMSKMDQMSIK